MRGHMQTAKNNRYKTVLSGTCILHIAPELVEPTFLEYKYLEETGAQYLDIIY